MKRRSFLGLGSLFLAPQGASGEDIPPENAFASSWNAWIALRAQDTPGIIDARELHAWKRVEEAWKEVRKAQSIRH